MEERVWAPRRDARQTTMNFQLKLRWEEGIGIWHMSGELRAYEKPTRDVKTHRFSVP